MQSGLALSQAEGTDYVSSSLSHLQLPLSNIVVLASLHWAGSIFPHEIIWFPQSQTFLCLRASEVASFPSGRCMPSSRQSARTLQHFSHFPKTIKGIHYPIVHYNVVHYKLPAAASLAMSCV